MTAPAKPLHDDLAVLDAAILAGRERVRAVEQEQRDATAKAEQLREQIVEAYASTDDRAAKKLQTQREAADRLAAEPWAEKIAGARRAVDRATAARDAFRREHWGDLSRERIPEAEAAAAGLKQAMAALVAAHDVWHREAGNQAALLRDVQGHRVPSLPEPIDSLRMEVKRALAREDVPVPMPVELAPLTIPAHDDTGIRNAARAQILGAA